MVGISVEIKAGFEKESCEITATGSVQHVITDKEAITFGIDGETLCNAIEKLSGKKPDVAFFRAGPDDYLYKEHNWDEVHVVLEAISATIIDVTSEPVILDRKESKNNLKNKATFTMEITQSVETTSESNWSATDTINFEQSIEYSIKFLGSGVSGTTRFGYSREWGEGGSKSQSHTIGSTHGASVELEPGEEVVGLLTASKGVLKARIVYQAKLIGYAAAAYPKRHEKHFHWCFDIDSVIKEVGISNSKEFTEDIEIGFFGNSRVELTDKNDSVAKSNNQKEDENKGESKKTDGDSDNKNEFGNSKLSCEGRSCAKCCMCRDWHFTGSPDIWNWICNKDNWNKESKDRWRDSVYKLFSKRDGATCIATDTPFIDLGMDFFSLHSIDLDGFGDHDFMPRFCLCDPH